MELSGAGYRLPSDAPDGAKLEVEFEAHPKDDRIRVAWMVADFSAHEALRRFAEGWEKIDG